MDVKSSEISEVWLYKKLIAACFRRDVLEARFCLDCGAPVFRLQIDDAGQIHVPPLHIAAVSGSIEMIQLLLDRGAGNFDHNCPCPASVASALLGHLSATVQLVRTTGWRAVDNTELEWFFTHYELIDRLECLWNLSELEPVIRGLALTDATPTELDELQTTTSLFNGLRHETLCAADALQLLRMKTASRQSRKL